MVANNIYYIEKLIDIDKLKARIELSKKCKSINIMAVGNFVR